MSIPSILFYEFSNSIENINIECFYDCNTGIIDMYEHLLEKAFTYELKEGKLNRKYPEIINTIDFYVFASIHSNLLNWGFIPSKSSMLYLKSLALGIIYKLIRKLNAEANNMFLGEQAHSILTQQESNYIPYLKKGYTAQQIAETLNVTVNTAQTHIRNIRQKTGMKKKEFVKNH